MYRSPRRGDLVGNEVGWVSWDWDRTTGDYFERGYFAYTGKVLGGDLTRGGGRFTIEGPRIEGEWTSTGDDVMHLDGGGLVKTSAAWEDGEPVIWWSGTLLETPGGGSRNGPRSK